MIVTVFVTNADRNFQWQSELLEHTWQQVKQPGELVRLVASPEQQSLPLHGLARVVRTRCWNPHPYVQDGYPLYNTPAGLWEWLLSERIDASLLLLDPDSVLLDSFQQEVGPGEAVGHDWPGMPCNGRGPFGLTKDYQNLQAFCVNRELRLSGVQFPVLIHSSDLTKIAPRWLELTAIIRTQVGRHVGGPSDALKVAYAIAAAEYRVPHAVRKMACETSDARADQPVLNYRQPVETAQGKILWDPEVYQPWQACEPERAAAGAGREFLHLLQQYAASRNSFMHLRLRRPRRRYGVREAMILDKMLLEVPGLTEPLQLNSSAAAIWKLCDNRRSLADIATTLADTFRVPRERICADVEHAINELHCDGALDLEAAE